MPRIELLETFETGHPRIDADHRALIELINAVSEAIENDQVGLCRDLLQSFIAAAGDHFRREEAILEALAFPRLGEHRVYHSDLLARAEAVRALCEESADRGELAGCFEELTSFIVDDVVRGDMDFVSHLAEAGAVTRRR